MVFNRSAFGSFKRGEMEHAALKRLAYKKPGQLSLYKHEGFWFAVDTIKELEDLNALWNSEAPPWRVWK